MERSGSKRGDKSGARSEKRRDHRDRSRDADGDYREGERREKKDHERNRERDRDRDRDRRKDREEKSRREKENDEQQEVPEQQKEVAGVESTREIEERIARMKESRKKKDEEDDVRAWVEKSRKMEKEKPKKVVPRSIAEQGEDDEEEEESAYKSKDLAGMKIRHDLERIVEGGEVVLTLKDSNVLAGGDINEDADELENVIITEQTLRSNAYREAKKKPGGSDDKFQNDINTTKSLLPQYDEVPKEEGIRLDESGEVNAESQKRLEEVRQKLQGAALKMQSLLGGDNTASDFYTKEEMLKFKKPKKQKKLRKKDMLDVDALEAEAKAAGLGATDLGSRTNNQRPKQEFDADEDDEMYNRLKKSRELAIKNLTQSMLGPQAIAARMKLEAGDEERSMEVDNKTSAAEKTVVITETEEFCLSLQPDEVISRRTANDAFEENEVDGQSAMEIYQEEPSEPKPNEPVKDEDDDNNDDLPIKEVPVGRGLAGALGLLKERGSLKESVEWGGRNMDKKPSKLVGVLDDDKKYEREIQLDRRDEYGRTLTPKESFRIVSHKFHGKNPGKRKQEKKMKQYEEELKQKQMAAGDTPLRSMEKMREVQMKTSTPYIVMSGHIKPGQTSDPRSGFATVEKEPIGSLTPMLGDRKVEHFLGIKRPPGDMGPPLPRKKSKA